MKPSTTLLGLLFLAPLTSSCRAQISTVAKPLATGTLLQTDFENGAAWPGNAPTAVGTIDIAGSTQPSLGLKSSTMISSGPLAVRNTESNLGKLTLAFMLSASATRPVVVRVESFDKAKKRTGGLFTVIYPAAPDFYQRYALDLDKMKPSATGKFAPDAPFLAFSFAIGGPNWQGIEKPEIRLDDVQFAKPAYYVSPVGSDTSDGRTEATALATPQKALDLAQAGDIIAVMNGTYLPASKQGGIASFRRAGTPAGWISLKNYPGQQPLFRVVNAWAGVRIGRASSEVPPGDNSPSLAYLEARGLHIRGEGDVAKAKYPDAIGKPDPLTNGGGIMADTRGETNKAHHLRFADNLIEFCPGGGIAPNEVDWVSIEGNISRNNCWTTMYGTSGISINGGANFDGTVGGYRDLIAGNIVSGNRTFEPWAAVKKISDGNGIIIDINQNGKLPEEQRFSGRTLIVNNLCVGNGGSGIHTLKSKRVDIINNTAYLNGASPELRWGQIFLQYTDDARVLNNILVSREDQPINTVSKNFNDKQNTDVVRAGNILFGGVEPLLGEGDKVTDPGFLSASLGPSNFNFRLRNGSPALSAGRGVAFSPFLDLDGQPRGPKPSSGAYQN